MPASRSKPIIGARMVSTDTVRSGQGSGARSLGSPRRRGRKECGREMAVGCRFPVISRLRAIFPDFGSRKFPVSGAGGARLRLF
jgi:hypothetical protein